MMRSTTSGTKNQKNSRVFKQINYNAAGVDAGAEFHYVAVPEERATPSVRKFATTTRGLYELADWLVESGIDTVAVEATGVYCIPLLEVLEERELRVLLAKPSSLKSVNDRQKTDMVDAQWIQMLHTFGLLRASFRPTQQVSKYRSYNRHRRMLIEHASTTIELMKKALIQMNVRLDQAVTDVTGKTGMLIIRAILNGERDSRVLAQMRDERCAKNEEAIAEDLFGKYSAEHLLELDHAVKTWDHYQRLIGECNERLEQHANDFEKKADRKNLPQARQKEKVRKNVLTFDARSIFYEIYGVDLTQIDGISTSTLSTLLAEVGPNFDQFKTDKHFTSWLRVCPGNNKTGGRNRSGKNRTTTNRLSTALRLAAQTLKSSKSALGVFYRRKKAQIGVEKAINAAAHKLARMIYLMVTERRNYVDPGPDHYEQKYKNRLIKSMEKRAKQLGYTLVKAS